MANPLRLLRSHLPVGRSTGYEGAPLHELLRLVSCSAA